MSNSPITTRLRFFLQMAARRVHGQPRSCPYCGGRQLRWLGRKKLVMDVLQCSECCLVFRYPKDSPDQSARYYQKEYQSGFVTGISEHLLRRYIESDFRGSPLDVSAKIAILKQLCPSGKVLDYGSSWGYGVWQLRRSGFDAMGFEVSRPRAAFGRECLGVPIFDELSLLYRPEWKGRFDVVFTNHVVEHLTDIRASFDLFTELLRPGGFVFHVLPNFTGRSARAGAFWHWIGRDHPIAPSEEFFLRVLPRHRMTRVGMASSPFDEKVAFLLLGDQWRERAREGDELLVVAWKGA